MYVFEIFVECWVDVQILLGVTDGDRDKFNKVEVFLELIVQWGRQISYGVGFLNFITFAQQFFNRVDIRIVDIF